MIDASSRPERYTLGKLGQEVLTHGPALLAGLPDLVAGFSGPERLRGDTRAAVQLRLAKLFGCPVCRALFPGLAQKAGLTADEVAAVLRGELALLPAEAGAALAWIEEVVAAGGQPPAAVPEAAASLTPGQRDHLVVYTRLDIVIHSVGLLFLPHSLIERAAD